MDPARHTGASQQHRFVSLPALGWDERTPGISPVDGRPTRCLIQPQFKPKIEGASPAELEDFLKSQVPLHCYVILIVFLFYKRVAVAEWML